MKIVYHIYCFHPNKDLLKRIFTILTKAGYSVKIEDNFHFAELWLKKWGEADLVICKDVSRRVVSWANHLRNKHIPVAMIVDESLCDDFLCIREDDLTDENILAIAHNCIEPTSELGGSIVLAPAPTGGLL